jgi:arylsulfatase A-like enzyme
MLAVSSAVGGAQATPVVYAIRYQFSPPIGKQFTCGAKPMAFLDQRPRVASFFGMIANLDENMGRLEAFLGETGLRENTILIFMTDNGGTSGVPVFNAGVRGKKIDLWEGGHRVPCFIRWPAGKLRAARDIAELTEVQDILPTLVDLCGLRKPRQARFDGLSLAKLLRGDQEHLPGRRGIAHREGAAQDCRLRPEAGRCDVGQGSGLHYRPQGRAGAAGDMVLRR